MKLKELKEQKLLQEFKYPWSKFLKIIEKFLESRTNISPEFKKEFITELHNGTFHSPVHGNHLQETIIKGQFSEIIESLASYIDETCENVYDYFYNRKRYGYAIPPLIELPNSKKITYKDIREIIEAHPSLTKHFKELQEEEKINSFLKRKEEVNSISPERYNEYYNHFKKTFKEGLDRYLRHLRQNNYKADEYLRNEITVENIKSIHKVEDLAPLFVKSAGSVRKAIPKVYSVVCTHNTSNTYFEEFLSENVKNKTYRKLKHFIQDWLEKHS